MNEVDKLYQKLLKAKQDRLDGIHHSIPFNIPGLQEKLYGIRKGFQYIVTAGSGIGKTQFTKAAFVFNAIRFAKEHNIDLKIYYFALEESKDQFILSTISATVKKETNLEISLAELQSLGDKILSDTNIQVISKYLPYVKDIYSKVVILDTLYEPSEMVSYVTTDLLSRGKLIEEVDEEGEKVFRYHPHNPYAFNLVVVDHIGLMSDENNAWNRISSWSKEYCLKILKKQFNCAVINIQQQSGEKLKAQYDMKGKPVVEKMIPSLDGLADNKTTYHDADVVIGVFDPFVYQIESMEGFNIPSMGGYFRSLHIIKNRFGSIGSIGTYYNGSTNTFKQLPIASKLTPQDYVKIRQGIYL